MMKKHLLLLPFLLLNLSVQAQNKELSKKDRDNLNIKYYEQIKSTFEKPEYHYSTRPYTPSNYFHPFNFNDEKQATLLDSLKSNSKLKFIRTEKDKRLSLCVTFPKMDVNTFSTIWETKLSLLEAHIYSSGNKEIELTTAFDYAINSIDTYKQNNIIMFNRLKLNKEMTLVDSTLDIDKCHGNVRFKLGFVVGYDSLRLDRSSISKTYKFGDAEIKVIDIIENKVIIQVIHSKIPFTNQNLTLLNFDSIGNNLVMDYKYIEQQSRMNSQQLNPELKKPLFLFTFTLRQVDYEIFKENPEISCEDKSKLFPLRQKNRPFTSYIVYCSYAPLKNSFILFKPIYGNEQILETKLSK